ncbi:hypothetical protein ACFOY8_15020 [Thalassospira xianhensis]|uniref:Uncharacterized protein n=1 Tax=Thalassospira xianhensis MCCC 1A02616 TaxID=1177929 RepID=A0A367UK99_9PROT|nr:hypothetical protein [Thalassospira xianhensis]RCK07542.1 hypothetical protein TH5_00205 [Thalassospira xianhensis MCCC 1A02616]
MYSLVVAVLSISLGVILALASAVYLGNTWFSNTATNQAKHLLAAAEQVAAASRIQQTEHGPLPNSRALVTAGHLSSNPSSATKVKWIGKSPTLSSSWFRYNEIWVLPIENLERQVTLDDIEDTPVCQEIEKMNGSDNNIEPIIASLSSVSLGPVKFDCIAYSYNSSHHILFAYKE